MTKKHEVVTTFPSHKWEDYGQHILPTFDKFWPSDVVLNVYLEGEQSLPIKFSDRINIINMETVIQPIREFEERNSDKGIGDLGTTGNIAMQAAKFARKVYAQLDTLKNTKANYVWFLDADVATLNPISHELLDTLTSHEHYIGCLPRKWKPKYTETGFICWDVKNPHHEEWMDIYESCYRDDQIFQYSAWHDCIAFDHATDTLIEANKISIADFGYGVKSMHPLVAGPLGAYFDHMKGKRKFAGYSPERVRNHR